MPAWSTTGGRILTGGAGLTIRLVNADKTRDGRDLTVWVPQRAIENSGLSLWQLQYGTGRELDVWGLTNGEGQVAAYRLNMPDPPRAESLTEYELNHGIPVYPEARVTLEKIEAGAGFYVEGAAWETVRDWFVEQMPRYGWLPWNGRMGPAQKTGVRLRFENGAWSWAEVWVEPNEQGAHLTIMWGRHRPGWHNAAGAGDEPPHIR